MEEKINIAEVLKNKPQGTKLYNLLYNIDVELDTIVTTGTKTIVWCTDKIDNNDVCHRFYSEFGTIEGYPDGLQILLPSKEMRDWRKFLWKKGDVLVTEDGSVHIIFEKFEDDAYTMFSGKYYYSKDGKKAYSYFRECDDVITEEFTLETEDAAQTYISTIEERLDGKLNRETLEIEKTQSEFKNGDILFVKCKGSTFIEIFNYSKKNGDLYDHASLDTTIHELDISGEYKIFKENIIEIRLATEEEKQQLFDALEKEGKAWDAEKKQIVDLKPKCEFKPFDKVLGRNEKGDVWEAELFSHYKEKSRYPFCCIGFSRKYCIPYNKETAHLLETTDDWEGGEQ
ncbi:hypothetical protein [Prevotella sp.]|nr:hypothetical protein [Prevotella sp.]